MPDTELCDGSDNDCDPSNTDGSVDLQVGVSCDGADSDPCQEGVRLCSGGALICSDYTGNNLEICDNGTDDDCDGNTDCADSDCASDPSCL